MNAENKKKVATELENNQPSNSNVQPNLNVQPNSNIQPNSSVQPYPNVHPQFNAQPYPGNLYPGNPYPNVHPIVIPNDETRDTCASIGCSIFNLIFCGCIFGIPAVIFSCKANDDVNAGRTIEAQSSAKIAKILNIIGIIFGSIGLLVGIIVLIVVLTSSPVNTVASILYYG